MSVQSDSLSVSRRRSGRSRRALWSGLGLVATLAIGAQALPSSPATAHGSAASPASRVYQCRFNDSFSNPQNPMCQQAWATNAAGLWDWMSMRIGDADGRHQELIPDGKLCSANLAAYSSLDTPSDLWPATVMVPGADGRYHVEHEATAPHATLYFRWYITRTGYDANQSLRWSDLDLVHDSGPLPALAHWHADIDLSGRTGRHLMYLIWQRSDSPEAFYGCSDVVFGETPPPPPTTTTTVAPTTVAPTTVAPTTVAPTTVAPTTVVPTTVVPTTVAPTTVVPTTVVTTTTAAPPNAVSLKLITTSDWGTGHCAQGIVSNTTSSTVNWSVRLSLSGAFTSTWDGTFRRSGTRVTVTGVAWNKSIAPGTTRSFGYCASGPPGTVL